MQDFDFESFRRKLLTISKPSRYIGNELVFGKKSNKVQPDDVKLALAFPEVYEIGYSYIGFRILYDILNHLDGVFTDRVFAPWVDMEELLRNENAPLFSIDLHYPLSSFDIIGFTLQYSLSYTNILNMIDLGGIPILSSDRKDDDPIIIAGGPLAFNPAPLEEFIDLFVIGDGEDAVVEIVENYKQIKNLSRNEKIKELSKLDGIYSPRYYGGKKIKKRVLQKLEKYKFPANQPINFAEVVQDRFAVELMRGCTRGCRFCYAGMIYRPVREVDENSVLNTIYEAYRECGANGFSFLSLSSSDYSGINSLSEKAEQLTAKSPLSVSFPSLRVDNLSDEIISLTARGTGKGFTVAPEAGSERLRRVINKNLTEEGIISGIEKIAGHGFKLIKLYFMIGLPTETYEDLDAIIELVKKIMKIGRFKINITFSAFIPQPFTPFQWEEQLEPGEIQKRIEYLFSGLSKYRKIKLNANKVEMTLIESVFARGDRESGKVLKRAFELGCRFDGWSEMLLYDKWMQAFNDVGVDYNGYFRERKLDEKLPWEMIDPLIDKEFLIAEKEKAYKELVTEDCKTGDCHYCGEIINHEVSSDFTAKLLEMSFGKAGVERNHCYYLKYKRDGNSIFFSHRELINLLPRVFVKSQIPIVYSVGYNKNPDVSYSPPLNVGFESDTEIIIIYTTRELIDRDIRKLNESSPDGINFTTYRKIKSKKSINFNSSSYLYRIKFQEKVPEMPLREIKTLIIKRKRQKMVKNVELKEKIFNIWYIEKNVIELEVTLDFPMKDFLIQAQFTNDKDYYKLLIRKIKVKCGQKYL